MRTRFANRQRALLDRRRSHVRRCPSKWTSLARSLYPLGPVGPSGTRLALALHRQLLPRPALVPTFLLRHGLRRPRRLSKATEHAGEAAFVGLEESVTTASAKTRAIVVVLSSGTTFLAVGCASRARTDGDTGSTRDHWARAALELSGLALVRAHWTRLALVGRFVVEGADRAGNWKVWLKCVIIVRLG